MTLTTGIERLRIRNFRVLRDVELDGLTPVTALLGPNGSGKSTLLDAIGFVGEALGGGLTTAWGNRGGLAELRSRETIGPVEIELICRVDGERFEYRLVVDEEDGAPVAAEERLTWSPDNPAAQVTLVSFRRGAGTIRRPGLEGRTEELTSPGLLAVGTFGTLSDNAHIAAFLGFVGRIQVMDLAPAQMRSGARGPLRGAGLDGNGANIAMRVRSLKDDRPDAWDEILRSLRQYVPRLEDFEPARLGDGSWIIRLKEQGIAEPILPENISDGTLLLLGYLMALRNPLSVLLFEEPENQVHPRLHYLLGEETRGAESDQIIVATHAPRFVDALRPDEVWTFARGNDGYAETKRASAEAPVVRMVESGGALGDLWTEGYFRFGDPLGERP
ncbi:MULTISPECIES: AAA family ATPase [Amycolatopsis]|uniref:ATPase n=1 Tax=Amycolatopsis bullii TaxID=941987 RepID=A0ABQ3KQP9_9PSEU|nr:AAA family ATPase [Amycolatopsis bullii]GHG45012.1 ATPase [Amycolatopsis bullii]